MEYRRLGPTDLKVSELCLGTMTMGWTGSQSDSFGVLDAFADSGGNFIDTADIYSYWAEGNPGGVAESWLGEWMTGSDRPRDQLVIATKVRGKMWEGPDGEGLGRAHIIKSVEESLKRLQTDYIDLYMPHWPDENTPLEETLRAFDDLVQQGKVRYLGASNHSWDALLDALRVSQQEGLAAYDCLQVHYNLVHRAEFEEALMGVCADYGLGVISYSSLAGGFLTGKYRPGESIPDTFRGAGNPKIQAYMTDRNLGLIECMDQMAETYQATVAQLAVAWMLNNPSVTSAVVGANAPAQLVETLGALNVSLTDEDTRILTQMSDWLV